MVMVNREGSNLVTVLHDSLRLLANSTDPVLGLKNNHVLCVCDIKLVL